MYRIFKFEPKLFQRKTAEDSLVMEWEIHQSLKRCTTIPVMQCVMKLKIPPLIQSLSERSGLLQAIEAMV